MSDSVRRQASPGIAELFPLRVHEIDCRGDGAFELLRNHRESSRRRQWSESFVCMPNPSCNHILRTQVLIIRRVLLRAKLTHSEDPECRKEVDFRKLTQLYPIMAANWTPEQLLGLGSPSPEFSAVRYRRQLHFFAELMINSFWKKILLLASSLKLMLRRQSLSSSSSSPRLPHHSRALVRTSMKPR